MRFHDWLFFTIYGHVIQGTVKTGIILATIFGGFTPALEKGSRPGQDGFFAWRLRQSDLFNRKIILKQG